MDTDDRMKPIVSFLIPTRKRVEGLKRTLQSISDNTRNTVEVLIRYDRDDEATKNVIESLEYPKIAGIAIEGDRPANGYGELYQLYNELAFHASGEFLWIFNDDAVILTKDFDELLARHTSQICVIKPETFLTADNAVAAANIFPLVHRRIVEVNGVFSTHSSIDKWYEIFAQEIGIEVQLPQLKVNHVGGFLAEHIKDNLPPTDPAGVYHQREYIRELAHRLKAQL